MPRTVSLIAALSVMLMAWGGAPPRAAAQQPTSQPALPDIAPREIEIQGTLEISLPSLQRQPLSGFNPPPRIPDIPPQRVPYVGEFGLDRQELPLQLPAPPGLQAQLDRPAAPINGELRAGGGRYFSRFAAGSLWLPLSATEIVTLDGDYQGSAGFAPFENQPDVESPYDTFTAEVGLQSRRDAFSLDADLAGFFDTYALYGAEVNPSNPRRLSIAPQPDRSASHLEAAVGLQTHGPIAFDARAQVSGTEYETTVFTGTPATDSLLAERRIRLRGGLTVPVGPSEGRIDVAFETAGLGADATFGSDVTAFDGGLTGALLARPGLRVDVGGRFLMAAVEPPARPDLTERQSARFFAPSFQVDWTASPTVTVFAHNTPSVETHPLAALFEHNPYLLGAVGVQPSLHTTDLEGGLRLFAGPLQFVARGGYRYAVAHRFVTTTLAATPTPSSALYAAGAFSTRYESARIIHAGADVSLQRMGGVEVSVGAAYRDGRLVDRDVALPYFAPLTGHAVFSYAFADQRGLIQLTGRFEAARYVDATETTQVDPFADVDLEAAFDVTPSLGLLMELRNVTAGSLERWDRYPRPPLVFTTGLRVRW